MARKKQPQKSAAESIAELDKAVKRIDSPEQFDVADGKYRENISKAQLRRQRELEELIGIPESNPFKTLNQEAFEASLEEMTKTDLQNMAMNVGIPPRGNPIKLKEELVKAFKQFRRAHNFGVAQPPQPIIDPSSPDYEKTVKLFKEGF